MSKVFRDGEEVKLKYYSSNNEVVQAYLNQWSRGGRNGNESIWFVDDILYSWGRHFPLAVRLDNLYNSYVINGDTYSASTSNHQSILFGLLPEENRIEIPFSAIGAMLQDFVDDSRISGINGYGQNTIVKFINTIDILDRTGERWVKTGRYDKEGNEIERHVLGGALFAVDVKDIEELVGNDKNISDDLPSTIKLLSGMDSTGADEWGRYFLTALKDSEGIETVEDAYESIKPETVKKAEEKGSEIKRQGEWFFIRLADGNKIEKMVKEGVAEVKKREGLKSKYESRTGSHKATRLVKFDTGDTEAQFVKGTVRHDRNEHSMLRLYDEVPAPPLKERDWWLAVENRQLGSWGAEGTVD